MNQNKNDDWLNIIEKSHGVKLKLWQKWYLRILIYRSVKKCVKIIKRSKNND